MKKEINVFGFVVSLDIEAEKKKPTKLIKSTSTLCTLQTVIQEEGKEDAIKNTSINCASKYGKTSDEFIAEWEKKYKEAMRGN